MGKYLGAKWDWANWDWAKWEDTIKIDTKCQYRQKSDWPGGYASSHASLLSNRT